MASLLSGRNSAPLSKAEVQRAISVFLVFDNQVNVRYEAGTYTRFRVVAATDDEDEYGEIVFSEDLYPGNNVAHANSLLSERAAAAHELAHFHRWRSKRELNGEDMRNLDEAQTSLEAAMMFNKNLSDIEIQQLIADATERLRLHIQSLT